MTLEKEEELYLKQIIKKEIRNEWNREYLKNKINQRKSKLTLWKKNNNLTKPLVRLTRKKEREDSNTKIKDERGTSLLTLQK